MNDFHFTLKVPAEPARLLQGSDLLDSCHGPPGGEQKLDHWLNQWSIKKLATPAVAVGFVRYDGSFWFGIPQHTRLITEQEFFRNHFSDLNHRQIKDTDAFRKSFTNRSQTIQSPSAVHSTSLNREQYIRAVQRAQQYIAAGDIYQVNICRIVSGPFSISADTLARRLLHISRAPYFSHIHLSDTDIISASPELFLEIQDDTITTQPIKGTRRRSQDPRKDAQLARELTTCPKELAELIMITDLERNDLGKICRYGSVRVTELAAQKVFPHVRHLVSTVTGTLLPGIGPARALFSCLPGGSITGAPKIRATQIISELEPEPRGLYCGVIGFFDLRAHAARFSIAIRTVELSRGVFRYGVGSGITADSIPAQEWEETNWKSAPLNQALGIRAEASVSVARGSNN